MSATALQPVWIGYGHDAGKTRRGLTGGFLPVFSHEVLPSEKNARFVKEPVGVYELPPHAEIPMRFVGNLLEENGWQFDGSRITRDGVEIGYGSALVPSRLIAGEIFAEVNRLIVGASRGLTFQTKQGIEKGETVNITIPL